MRGMRSRSRPRKGRIIAHKQETGGVVSADERERKAASSRGMSMRCRTHGLSNYSSIVISHDASKTSIPSPLPNYTFPSLCTSITTIMAGIRPPVLDAAFRSCTRARRAPALRNAPFSNRSPAVQRRWIGDMNGSPRTQDSPGSRGCLHWRPDLLNGKEHLTHQVEDCNS
jgi:hypothetical protein